MRRNIFDDSTYEKNTIYRNIKYYIHFDRSIIYQIVQKMAPFDLTDEADYPDNTTFFI